MLSVWLLGGFRAECDGSPVTEIDAPRLQSLLAYLLVHRGAPQSRGHLAFLFWPDTNEAQARTNLRNLLHHLRRALPDADLHLEANVHTLCLRSDVPIAFDVADFEAALEEAERAWRGARSSSARDVLERAVALYKGDLLPSCYDDWIIAQRETLREGYLVALERLIRLAEEQRDYKVAIRHARCLLRHDPLHEPAYAHVMRLNALSDDRASALNLAEVVAACGRPCRYDILCETPGDSYDFSHEKLREVCYHSMSAAHRRWVQQRLDEASPSGARAA